MHITSHTLHTSQSLRHQTLSRWKLLAHCSGRGELEGRPLNVWSHPASLLDKSGKTGFTAVIIAHHMYKIHMGAV